MTKRVHVSNFKIYCISQDSYLGSYGYTHKITWSKKKAVIDAAMTMLERAKLGTIHEYNNIKGIEDLEIHEFVLAPAIATPLKDLV